VHLIFFLWTSSFDIGSRSEKTTSKNNLRGSEVNVEISFIAGSLGIFYICFRYCIYYLLKILLNKDLSI
jgi:hypothetical protein